MENTVHVNKNDGLKRFVNMIDQYFARDDGEAGI